MTTLATAPVLQLQLHMVIYLIQQNMPSSLLSPKERFSDNTIIKLIMSIGVKLVNSAQNT